MDLKDYFEKTKGVGVLATADNNGKVAAAVYARPHIMDDGTVAMIMRERLTHANLQLNPHAAFLFMENGPGFKGKRFFLTRIREEGDGELLQSLKRRCVSPEDDADKGAKFLVVFKIDKELPLVGSE